MKKLKPGTLELFEVELVGNVLSVACTKCKSYGVRIGVQPEDKSVADTVERYEGHLLHLEEHRANHDGRLEYEERDAIPGSTPPPPISAAPKKKRWPWS